MKKFILFILFISSFNSNAQCGFNLDELLSLMVSNSSDYETKILTKGYEYDSETDIYFCDIYNNPFGLTKRFQSGQYYGFLYTTYSKENYLDIKKRIVEMKFTFSEKIPVRNTDGLLYKANNIRITLFTETIELKPNYNILIQVDLLDTK
jgi:hypothetical protein